MVNEDMSGKIIPVAAGAALGVLVFWGLSLWFGHTIFPSVESLPTYPKDEKPSPTAVARAAAMPSGPVDPAAQAYMAACGACHQQDGKGLAGTFPPLAASSWVAGDPETPIRIVVAGLGGPIEVDGQKYNSLMPPPAGLDDEKIATILTYVRSSFGNDAPAIDKTKVAEVRAAIAARTTPWTAEELLALRAPSAAPEGSTDEAAAPQDAAIEPAAAPQP
jgi:mono/diheme cytochrome c family protein